MYNKQTQDHINSVSLFFGKLIINFCIGVTIMVLISTIFNLANGSKLYYATSPAFYEDFETHLIPTLISFGIGGIIGVIATLLSEIYSIEKLSLLCKSLLHLGSMFVLIFSAGYYLKWYHLKSLSEIISVLATFIIIYFVIWTIGYLQAKREWQHINDQLKS